MNTSAVQGGSQLRRTQVYVAIMIGPPTSGKTSFAKKTLKYFRTNFTDIEMNLLFYDTCTYSQIIYQLKKYTIDSISQGRRTESKTVIIVDSKNLHETKKRFDIFMFCLKFNIIFLQIYMDFDSCEVVSRCAKRGLFLNPQVLQNPEFFNTTCLGSGPNMKWQNNSITICKTFRKNGETQFIRLRNFLLNCVPPTKDNFLVNCVPRAPLESSNSHQLQMQAGISYKDKLLHGKGLSDEDKKKLEKSSQKRRYFN